jgi:hypothetical protein
MDGMTLLIERFKEDRNYKGYIETIVDFAKENDIEIEDITDNIDPILKKKIETEFIKMNYFPDRKIEGALDDFLAD